MRVLNFDYSITHSKKEKEDIDSLMKRLGEVVRKHRLLLKPFFQDKDISKIGRVSFTRMRSILDNNKLPLTDYQYELLCKNFAYDTDEFNYVDFIEVLRQYEEENWQIFLFKSFDWMFYFYLLYFIQLNENKIKKDSKINN